MSTQHWAARLASCRRAGPGLTHRSIGGRSRTSRGNISRPVGLGTRTTGVPAATARLRMLDIHQEMNRMKQRALADPQVGAIGLGGMPMSIEGRPERSRSVATIHAALDAGVTLVDTADAYHLHADEVGHNEELIADALGSWDGDATSVLVATKGGQLRPGDGSWTRNGDPTYLKKGARASARRLEVDAIRQNQFSPAFRSSRGELDHCAEFGIAFPGASRPASIEVSVPAADLELTGEG